MGLRDLFFLGAVLAGAATLTAGLSRPAVRVEPRTSAAAETVREARAVASEIDAALHRRWAEESLTHAPAAPELAVMRRLALALTGSVPSLEEIRRFEATPGGARIDAWLEDLLQDRRCADYLAERLARAYVGTEDGPFILFRRRRFAAWLSDAILADRTYDAIVREMIAEKGLWTDYPATNFHRCSIAATSSPWPGWARAGSRPSGTSWRSRRRGREDPPNP